MFKQKWAHGAKICATVAVTFFPGAFYTTILTGILSAIVTMKPFDIGLIWGITGIALVTFFVGDHADLIQNSAEKSN